MARLWLVNITASRARGQWGLLLAVTAIATLASALVATLGLVSTATEADGVRGALSSLPPAQSNIVVQVVDPSTSIGDARVAMDAAVSGALGAVPVEAASAGARSALGKTSLVATHPTAAYFAELDGIDSAATLVAGTWAVADAGADHVAAALPLAASTAFGLGVGDTFTVATSGSANITVTVAGIFEPHDADDRFWEVDLLHGSGSQAAFQDPEVSVPRPLAAFGPLVTDAGALDEAGVAAEFVRVEFEPGFASVAPGELLPLIDRLDGAEIEVRRQLVPVSDLVTYASTASDAVSAVATGLIVTRSTVLVVGLMLLVLGLFAIAQAARLLADSRAGERRLMRSRGAAPWQVLVLAAAEALGIAAIVAVASPFVALGFTRVLAWLPLMSAAGGPAPALPQAGTWWVSAATAALFALTLLVPLLLTPAHREEKADSARARPRSVVMRSGLDLALVLLAVLAMWQLQSYRSVIDSQGSLTIDPMLAGAPALALLAAALLSVRLIPAAASLVERLAARSRGVVVPLAAWGIGRRARRATAAVLLLSLALAVGTFGLSFLSTWRQSQVDQASLAAGAPIRAQADPQALGEQRAGLEADSDTSPQPVLRATTRVSTLVAQLADGAPAAGTAAQLIALTPAARSMLDRGRLGEEGGARIAELLDGGPEVAEGVPLPESSAGVTARVTLDGLGEHPDSVAVEVRAMLEDGNGVLFTPTFEPVPADGMPHVVTAVVEPAGPLAEPVHLVGWQAVFSPGAAGPSPTPLTVSLAVSDVAALEPADRAASSPTPLGGAEPWRARAVNDTGATTVAVQGDGAGFTTTGIAIPADLEPGGEAVVITAWQPGQPVEVVASESLVKVLRADPGERLVAVFREVSIPVTLAGTVPVVPGAAGGDALGADGFGLAASLQAHTVVVDAEALARSLAEVGVAGGIVSEWWIDPLVDSAGTWIEAHEREGTVIHSASELALGMQQSPLRIGTQLALWLAILAGAGLAAVGVAVHTATSLRERRLELAQLGALGLPRSGLLALVTIETVLLALLGSVFGIAIGVALTWLVGPLVALAPDGSSPIPDVDVIVPWHEIALLSLGMFGLLAAIVVATSFLLRTARPADILRWGGAS